MKHSPRITRSTKLQVGKNGKSEADSFDLLSLGHRSFRAKIYGHETKSLKRLPTENEAEHKSLELPFGRAP